ncbi:C4-dicarboxylate transport sensor protein DctB [Kaistia sp. 32K]|uniref:sensor histidine kinase n=1 Tax=Kaistia sp. 32K TaxID=2795690 RepID=UPI0019154C25|nr:ATP-binding protein [Kaistia sp. 32K]BCP53528.1 C4-dicarboxylate transport sensor protein DctB [Kaistia sp. 32K]
MSERADPKARQNSWLSTSRLTWWAFAAICLVVFGVALWLVGNAARDKALVTLSEQTEIDANLNTALLRRVLERQRAVPLILSKDKELADALSSHDPAASERLSRKLETLAEGTQAAVIYLVDLDGKAISASNWRDTDSFVGRDYNFRPYFKAALENGEAEYFALGNVSLRPGLYISRRVDGPNGPLGAIVVKLSFDELEKVWNQTGRPTFVVDDRGIVLITSIPSWRFLTIGRLGGDEIDAIHASLQFGDASLTPLPLSIKPLDGDQAVLVDAVVPGSSRNTEFIAIHSAVPTTPWQMYSLAPLRPQIDAAVREARLLTFIVLASLATLVGYLLRRKQKIAARIADAQRRQVELEKSVVERTEDLMKARDRLEAEIGERLKTETVLQGVQQDLVHANRLAILGQVAAGVAHEINQPVATIRAFADNARTFIDRKNLDAAAENLQEIAGLTERIGTITGDLRALARKGHRPSEPVELGQVITGALVLLRSRFSGRMDQIHMQLPPPDLCVVGHAIRLEQVLINLFQNALEAVEGMGQDGHIDVRIEERRDTVIVSVSDNGPGIAPNIRENLFIPFNTSKEKGLGLGLVIVKEILADYGGGISVDSAPHGTVFHLEFRKA